MKDRTRSRRRTRVCSPAETTCAARISSCARCTMGVRLRGGSWQCCREVRTSWVLSGKSRRSFRCRRGYTETMNDSSSNTHVVEALERQIEQLKPEDFARLREWFLSYEWDAWDHALEEDVGAG